MALHFSVNVYTKCSSCGCDVWVSVSYSFCIYIIYACTLLSLHAPGNLCVDVHFFPIIQVVFCFCPLTSHLTLTFIAPFSFDSC